MDVIVEMDSADANAAAGLDSKEMPLRILVVEDTEDNRFMMRRLLEISGYRVSEAVNGQEAVHVAQRDKPAAILMDLSLPMVDGLAATRQIRQLPELKKVPIIAVSAHDTADFHAEALAAGCDAYITKPIDYVELEDLIARLVSNYKKLTKPLGSSQLH